MLIVSIDTSNEQAGLALVDGTSVRAEWSWTAAGNHSQHLSALLESMLRTEHLQARDLDAVVVATGPGSFSGLRVGVGFAKGLALSLGVPLSGVPTLDAIGYAALFLSEDVLAAMGAGREQLYVARYQGVPEDHARTGEYAIMLPSQAATFVSERTLLCGPGADVMETELERQGRPARREPAVWRLRRPAFLAELGREILERGGTDQVHTVEPLYLRRPAAEEKRMAEQE